MTRVSERLRYDSTNNRIDTVRQMADNAQETTVSGRKLRKVSDDPSGAVRVFRNRTKLENVQQFRKTLDFAKGFMGRTEDALISLNEVLVRARELAVQQANSTWDGVDRRAVSEELKQMIGHAVSLGNSTYSDRYVFGGFKTQQPPIGADGSFSGDDGLIYVQVDEETFRPINISGRELFEGQIGEDNDQTRLVGGLRKLREALDTNDVGGIRDSIGMLDKSITRVINSVAAIGARRAAVDDVEERLDKSEERLYSDNNDIEGIDLVKSTMDLKRAESAVQYTLQSSAKMLTPSLMNFLQ